MVKKQSGFSVIWIIVVIVVLAVIGSGYLVLSKDSKETNQQASQQPASNTSTQTKDELVLRNVGLENFDSMEISSNALREYDSKGIKGFYVFGETLPSNGQTVRKNPNLEFSSLGQGTEIISALDGVVVDVKNQGDDSEIIIVPSENSQWQVGYDHLTNVTVKKGQEVKANQILGLAAVQGNGLHRFEFQVNGKDGMYCPVDYLDSAIKTELVDKLTNMMTSWNNIKTGLYDLSMQKPVGCLKEFMTFAEAEGK